MIDADRKLLMGKMGETWHETLPHEPDSAWLRCSCGVKWWYTEHHDWHVHNRTFDTWQDFGDLKEKLFPGDGAVQDFFLWIWSGFSTPHEIKGRAWWELQNPEKRCELILKFGRERLGWKEV